MFWKFYFVLNLILFIISTIVLFGFGGQVSEWLAYLAGVIGVIGLFSHIYKNNYFSKYAWTLGLIFILLFGLINNLVYFLSQKETMEGLDIYIYFGLLLFSFPIYYLFYKHIERDYIKDL
jgi:hypothetical protein